MTAPWPARHLRRALAVLGPDLTPDEWAARSGWPALIVEHLLLHPGQMWRSMRRARDWSREAVAFEVGITTDGLAWLERGLGKGSARLAWALHGSLVGGEIPARVVRRAA